MNRISNKTYQTKTYNMVICQFSLLIPQLNVFFMVMYIWPFASFNELKSVFGYCALIVIL